MARTKKSFSKSEKKLILLASLSITFLFALGAWRVYTDAQLDIVIPATPTPAVNAFTLYTSAGKALVNYHRVSAVHGDSVPIKPSAKTVTPKQAVAPNGFTQRPATLTEQIAVVRPNLANLKLLRLGLTQQYQEPPVRSFSTGLYYYANYQRLAELLILQGRIEAKRGNRKKAIQCFLEAMQFGAQISKGASASIIALSYGYRFEYFGQKEIWKHLHQLNLQETQLALRELEQLDVMQPSLSKSLQEHKWLIQASLLELFQERQWQRYVADLMEGGCVPVADWKRVASVQIAGKHKIMQEYSAFMDQAIAEAQQPASLRRNLKDETLITYGLQPNLETLNFQEMKNRTQVALLRVALALHAYRLLNKKYPPSLASLKTRFLDTLPDDSFKAGHALNYQRTRDGYLLYSIGPDGADNHGQAVERKLGDQRIFGVGIDSEGDFVAGINH